MLNVANRIWITINNNSLVCVCSNVTQRGDVDINQ